MLSKHANTLRKLKKITWKEMFSKHAKTKCKLKK